MNKKRFILIIGFLFLVFLVGSVLAEKLEIKIIDGKDNYVPGEDIKFKITVYDDSLNKLNVKVNYEIQNYYKDVVKTEEINSDSEVIFQIPENAIRGYWGVIASYNGVVEEELFNVAELEKAEIKLEGDNLIITNTGNVPYEKPIQIAIGNNKETALVPLNVGQIKKIRLTAPPGQYDISVSDGTEENNLEFKGVSLTGNVVGLEKVVEGNIIQKYPLISLFLFTLVLLVIVIFGSKIYRKISK